MRSSMFRASVVLSVALVAASFASAAPVIVNGSFETATIGTWGIGSWGDPAKPFVPKGPPQGTALISDWGNGATSVADWTFSTSLNGGVLSGDGMMGMYLRQAPEVDGNGVVVPHYSAHVAPTPFGTRQWNLLHGSTVSQSFAVKAGTQYTVAYYQCNTAGAAPGVKLTARISGVAATGTLTQDANTSFADGLQLHTFTFTPTERGTATLSFSAGTTPAQKSTCGAQLDNVSVTMVSKPGTAAQMPVMAGPVEGGGFAAAQWECLESFVPAYNRVWTASPLVATENTVYAPLMGNGNMCACVSGGNNSQVYYMRTADFWTDDGSSGNHLVREIPSGCLKIGLAASNPPPAATGQCPGYRQEEEMLDAEIHSTLPFEGYGLKVKSFVAATENTMALELSSARPVRVSVELNADVLDRVAAYPAAAGMDGNMIWLTRETNNRQGARWISRNAYAARILGAGPVTCEAVGNDRARATFEIPSNATVTVLVCLDGGKNATNHLSAAKGRVSNFSEKNIARLKESHRNWWKTNWWSKGYVRTYDDAMDRHYFRSLYLLGTMCREGYVNSGLHGPWKASDTQHNYSSYCMNDLEAASYYIPLISSDRASAAKMWIQTVYDWIPEGQRRAIKDAGLTRGVFFPVHWAPWGSTYEDIYWGQKFCASFASIIGNWYYRDTEDVAYLRERIYPFMKECANFYEDWLTKEADGKYHVRGASYESGSDNYQNSCLDLVYARILFTDILKYSEVLGVDADRREKWRDIRDNLNDFSVTSMNGMAVYQADSSTPFTMSVNVIQTQIIYPGYTCNRRSAPKARELGSNTMVQAMIFSGWVQDNMRGQGAHVAALRSGAFNVEDLIAHFKTMLLSRLGSNASSPVDYPTYIADAGLWEFNNQLCMQCYDEGVMFFPDSPATRSLSFNGLRALGAFLCSGEFKEGAADVSVYSEKGNPFTVITSGRIDVSNARGRVVPVRRAGDRCTFDTVAGKMYRIALARQQEE